MAFIRSKTVGGKKYYQLVQNYRDAGRHRQKVLCHLGINDNFEGAIAEASCEEALLRSEESKCLRDLEGMKEDILAMFNNKYGDDLPTHSEAVKRSRAIHEEDANLLQQPWSWERSAALEKLWQEWRFLREVNVYHWNLWRADWYKKKADTKRARLEKLRMFQKEHG